MIGKNFVGLLVLYSMVAAILSPLVAAGSDDVVASGQEGNCIAWTFLSNGTIVLSGDGGTLDYNKEGSAPTIKDRPWNAYKTEIKTLIVNEGIDRIGNRAFQGYKSLKNVVLPNTMASIGIWAFQNCTNLSNVTIPTDVKINTGAFRNTPVEPDIAATESAEYVGSVYYARLVQTGLTGNYRNDVIAIARSQIGYHEGDSEADFGGGNLTGSGDYTEYGRYFFNTPSTWCSEFTSWCIRMSGAPFLVVNSSTGANAKTYTAGSRATYYPWTGTIWGGGSYSPRKGDVILWVWSDFTGEYKYDSSLSHTTLLENWSVSGDEITFSVVHGNSGGKVGTKKYVVNKLNGYLSNGNGYVGYFVAPDYECEEIDKYIVEFDANGGSVEIPQKTVAIGGLYGPLPVPYRTGCSFLGWHSQEGRSINMYSPCRIADSQMISGPGGEKGSIKLVAGWRGLDAEVFPEVATNAGLEKVSAALAGTVDAHIAANITNAIQYAAYRTWALSLTNEMVTARTVKESARAWLSYALGANALIEREITSNDLRIVSFTLVENSGNIPAAQFSFEVAIDGVDIGGGTVEEAVLKENLKKVIRMEGAKALSSDAFSSDNLDITFDSPVEGKARFTVKPPIDADNIYFMRVRLCSLEIAVVIRADFRKSKRYECKP
jgi:hypothetical protein